MTFTRIMRRISPLVVAAGISLFPLASAAQGGLQNVKNLANDFKDILFIALAIVFTLALVVFSWGVVKYISAAGDAAKLKDARPLLFWGLLGIFVLAAMMGLVTFIGESLDISTTGGGTLSPPTVETPDF